jgi:hypothetical protein
MSAAMPQSPSPRQPWPTLATLWRWVVPVGLFIRLCLSSIYPNDFWWHVRTGLITLQTGQLPTVDLFSYTQAGQPWINQAWLMQVALALLHQAGGVPLVILAHALIITGGYTLVLAVCAPRYGLRLSVLATVLGVAVSIKNFAVRPQTVSFLGFGLLLCLIEAHRRERKHLLWWAVPLFAVWVNAHGAFIFGVAGLGFYVVGCLWDGLYARARGRAPGRGVWTSPPRDLLILAAQGLAGLAALMLNPQGPVGIAGYILGFFQSKATIELNIEFSPLIIRELDGQLFALATLVLIVARLRGDVRLETGQTLGVLAFAAMTLFSRRAAPWYGMWLIPILAAALQGWLRSPRPLNVGKPLLNRLILGLLILMALTALPFWRPALSALMARSPLLSDDTPVAATTFLCETAPAGTHGFAPLAFAGYLVYACPDLPVFVDTRIELYAAEHWRDYLALHNARYDWQAIADRYAMDYLFVQPDKQKDLVAAAAASPAWREIYRDEQAVIFLTDDR